MKRLGTFVVRRRRMVIVAWIAILFVTAAIGSSAFSVLSSEFGAGTSTESGRVAHQLDELGHWSCRFGRGSRTMTHHVVFGTGQVGGHVGQRTDPCGDDRRVVQRPSTG